MRVRPGGENVSDPMRSWGGGIADPAARNMMSATDAVSFVGLAQAAPSSGSSNISYTTGPKSLSNTYTASSVMSGSKA